MTSNFICTPEYIVNGVSVDYKTYCEHQLTLKRSKRYYYCQNPGCYEGFDGKTKKLANRKYCSPECGHAHNKYTYEQEIIKYNKNPNLCKFDSKPILYNPDTVRDLGSLKKKTFCNNSCVAQYNNKGRIRTEESKNKISKILKERYDNGKLEYVKKLRNSNRYNPSFKKEAIKKRRQKNPYKVYPNEYISYFPLHCNNPKCYIFFIHKDKNAKYCSPQCLHEFKDVNNRINGYGKSGKYKGIHCDSMWELAYLIYCLDHNINIKRNTEWFSYIDNNKKRAYNPDFIVNGELIEIKGIHTELVDKKKQAIQELGLTIHILYRKDLTHMFSYIKQKYNVNRQELFYLYDDVKKEIKECENPLCDNILLIAGDKKNHKYCNNKCYNQHLQNKRMSQDYSI